MRNRSGLSLNAVIPVHSFPLRLLYLNSSSTPPPPPLPDKRERERERGGTLTFVVPRVNTEIFGERSFSYTGLSVWNNLPRSVRHSDSSSTVKTALKTHLFQKCFLPVSLFTAGFFFFWSLRSESGVCVCARACACVSVAIAIVKRPVLPLYVEDRLCKITTKKLYCYY